MNIPNNLETTCKKYRKELFEKFLEVGQGHPGSVFSLIEIVTTLFHKSFIRFDKSKNLFKDKIIISKDSVYKFFIKHIIKKVHFVVNLSNNIFDEIKDYLEGL